MILLVAYNSGVREYTLLLAIVALIASTMPYGYLTEVFARPPRPHRWCSPLGQRLQAHVFGYVPQVAAWFCIVVNLHDNTYADSPPAFVYAIVYTQLSLFFSFGAVQLVQQIRQPRAYYRGELTYQALSLACKGTLGCLFLFNVLTLGRFDDIFD